MKDVIRNINKLVDYVKNSTPMNEEDAKIKHELVCEATMLDQAKYDLLEAYWMKKTVDKIYNKHKDSIFDEENHPVLVDIFKELLRV